MLSLMALKFWGKLAQERFRSPTPPKVAPGQSGACEGVSRIAPCLAAGSRAPLDVFNIK